MDVLKILVFFALMKMALTEEEEEEEEEEVVHPTGKSFLSKDYDNKIRPNMDKGKPLHIKLDLYIESFGRVDVAKMEMEFYGYVMQKWKDDRLKALNNTPLILQGHDSTALWLPDIYCVNCRKTNLDVGRNHKENMVRINNNASVYFSNGITLVTTCEMDLKRFPFDRQSCEIKFCSYAYNTKHIIYSWESNAFVHLKSLDQYDLIDIRTRVEDAGYTSGKFKQAVATFTFERRTGFYILQVFLPTAMLVALSWTMFGLDHGNVGDRLTIGITLFLTMIFLHGYANTSLPKVSYIKLLDIYMVVSVFEILVAILESVVIYKMQATEEMLHVQTKLSLRKRSRSESKKVSVSDIHESNNANMEKSSNENHKMLAYKEFIPEENDRQIMNIFNCKKVKPGATKKKCKKPFTKAKRVDRFFSFVVPVSYIVFNVWFWAHILQSGHNHKHH